MISWKIVLACTILCLAFLLSSCEEECKTCYFIEATNGVPVNEHLDGEYCGEEIEERESQEFNCIQGDCYVECR